MSSRQWTLGRLADMLPAATLAIAGLSLVLSLCTATEARQALNVRIAANVRSAPFGAKGDGRTDDTAAIQSAINKNARVYLPAGTYRIDPRVGLRIRTGTQLTGDGRANTFLVAMPGGGSAQDLANYGPGSLIRRDFDPDGPNAYVAYVHLADFSVILTHPKQAITGDAIQVGIDLRNVSRSSVERVHVGNTPPIGGRISRASAHVFDSQGYGIVLGSVPSSIVSYAGGELNVVRDASVWGAYKGIVQDDEVLTPRSAAHGTIIERADIQGAQFLLSQESGYARAFVWRDNILQNVIPQPGGNSQATVMRIDGKEVRVDGGYVEAGGLASYLVSLGPLTDGVSIDLLHTSCTNKPVNRDRGKRNTIRTGDDCAASLRHD